MSIKYDYDFCVVINTYNRPEMLKKLLDNLEKEKIHFRIKILVFNDGSTVDYDLSNYDVKQFKIFPNKGKKKYWELINQSFGIIKYIKSEYFIFLPDDVTLIDDFYSKAKNLYESITDSNKICLNILTDNRVYSENWTSFKSVDFGDYLKTQWNDLCFISNKDFFEKLNYKINEIPISRWNKNENLSSGVGQQISSRLHQLGFSMYHSKKSLVNHTDHESKMNKEERKITKIITN
jgi:hypothetical protein